MPMIDGQKMACEPCIRGHRSTKCNHAKERLMVPVRKPGRPLSVCPHPPNRPCGCGGVTAAIPRTQKCGCGSNGASGGPTSQRVDLPGPKGPGSPTRRSFHIHKPGVKLGNRIDTTALERTDISHLNIHAPPPWNSMAIPYVPNTGFMVPAHPTAAPMPYQSPLPNGFHQPEDMEYGDSPYMTTPRRSIQLAVPAAGVKLNPEHQMPPEALAAQGYSGASSNSKTLTVGSCCAPRVSSPTKHTPNSSNGSTTSTALTATTNSCCSDDPVDAKENSALLLQPYQRINGLPLALEIKTNGTHHPQMSSPTDAMSAAFSQGMNSPPIFPPYFQAQGPVVYTYPATYGTMASPLEPAQWRQTMSTMLYDQDSANPIVLSPGSGVPFPANGLASVPGTSHVCSCGDSCDCLGCPAHPYNEVTQNYVRSAVNSMMEHPRAETFNGSAAEDASNIGVGAGHAFGPDPASPQAQTPSDASGLSEDQAQLSAKDFFFVRYYCGGETISCPCGDDCQCVGCLIHTSNPDET